MKIRQHDLSCLSHASWMITDEKMTTAALVDSRRDGDQCRGDATSGGYGIKHVFLVPACSARGPRGSR